jgi:hypothetical protein
LKLEGIVGNDNETVDAAQIELEAALLTEKLLAEHLIWESREAFLLYFPFVDWQLSR